MKMAWLTLRSLASFLLAVAVASVAAVAVGLMEDQNVSSRSWANITHQFAYSPSIPISYTVRQLVFFSIIY
jgi:hypothetical protein